MKWLVPPLALLALAASVTTTGAQPAGGEHVVLAPQELRWGPAPPALPPGAQAVILYGDPAKEGLFALRLKLPDGYVIPPHTHPRPEIVTVISGAANLGMGEKADRAKARALPAGSFFALEPGMAHYAHATGETVVQLNSTGPWAVNYVNPADDPRRAAAR